VQVCDKAGLDWGGRLPHIQPPQLWRALIQIYPLGFLPFVTIFEIVTRLPFFAAPHGSGKKELGPAGLSDLAICAACNPFGPRFAKPPLAAQNLPAVEASALCIRQVRWAILACYVDLF
jgi:hypothetical protein